MDKKNLAFDKVNFILLAIGFAVVVLGFILMAGGGTDGSAFNPDIFSALHIKVAPVVCFCGFISMIYAIVRKPKDTDNANTQNNEEEAAE
jgi:membrane-bound ClpP family serine protease